MSKETSKSFDVKISRLERELTDLKAERDVLAAKEEARTPIQNLAVALHEVSCHSNHTDQCSWYYEDESKSYTWEDINKYSAHSIYIKKAKTLMEEFPDMSIDDFVRISEII